MDDTDPNPKPEGPCVFDGIHCWHWMFSPEACCHCGSDVDSDDDRCRGKMMTTEHTVKTSGSIITTLDWLTDHGFPRAWFLHGRNGSAVIFQEDYHSAPQIAMQGDKLLFKEGDATDRPYIVITQSEPEGEPSQ